MKHPETPLLAWATELLGFCPDDIDPSSIQCQCERWHPQVADMIGWRGFGRAAEQITDRKLDIVLTQYEYRDEWTVMLQSPVAGYRIITRATNSDPAIAAWQALRSAVDWAETRLLT